MYVCLCVRADVVINFVDAHMFVVTQLDRRRTIIKNKNWATPDFHKHPSYLNNSTVRTCTYVHTHKQLKKWSQADQPHSLSLKAKKPRKGGSSYL